MGRKDPSQPSYWVYTHKVFAIYYDPVTRRVLDASMEVSELRHVSAAEKLIFRQSVFWLPRAEADFKPRTMLGRQFLFLMSGLFSSVTKGRLEDVESFYE